MDRARWLQVSAAVLCELLDLLLPQERDAAFEELVAKVRTKRARSRSAVLEPVRSATPAGGYRPDPSVQTVPLGSLKPSKTARVIPREEPK